MNYRYKKDHNIDAYGDTETVIHLKFGDIRKHYFFTKEFQEQHPNFCKEYAKYFMGEKSLFTDPLSIVNYIEAFNLPVKLYSNYVDQEFEDIAAVKEWICNEYQGANNRELYKYDSGNYTGLDGEVAK
jgi:hypothetical protein